MGKKPTPDQQQVIDNRGGDLLVAAAAGSGKTKVLVDRLLSYILDPMVCANIDDFLIITYTKAAAAELRGKIASRLTEELSVQPENRHLQRQLQRLYLAKISTVHAFCSDLLREYAYKLDITADFGMIDESQGELLRLQVLSQVLEEAYGSGGDDPDFCAFVDTQGFGRKDTAVEEIILQVYDKSRCHLRPKEYLQMCLSRTDAEGLTDAAQSIYGQTVLSHLHSYLDLQIAAMERITCLACQEADMEKPAQLLQQTLLQLQKLRGCTTWEDALACKDIQFGTLRFSKKADAEAAERIKAVRDACKKNIVKFTKALSDPSQQILQDLRESGVALRGLISLVNQFSDAYDRAKKRRHCLDFSDLEHLTLDLLLGKSRSGITPTAREIGERFREVLVDEYQDSNAVQDAIFACLTQQKHNCFMVGDVKQSIYQFRLADPGIFLEKYSRFPMAKDAQPGQGRKILLRENFRSGGAVLDASNAVFSLCMSPQVGGLAYTEQEYLREGVPHPSLGEPEVELAAIEVSDDTYLEEAGFVAQRIAQLLDGTHFVREGDANRPIQPQDIAILLRSPNSVGEYYRQALEKAGIACATGNQADLFASDEISVLISLLEIIDNPRQDIALLAVLASPIFGFKVDTLARLRANAKSFLFYDALCQSQDTDAVKFLQTLEQLRFVARSGSITALLEEIFLQTRLDSIYGAMEDGQERREHLSTFFQLASQQEGTGIQDLSGFLDHIHSLQEKGLAGSDPAGGNAVQLLSIHKSKGLEYPVVFLCGLSRGFNRESQRENVLCHRDLGLGLSAVDRENRVRYPTVAKRAIALEIGQQSLSEEMRVLYVAMTRAKDRLIMTYAHDSLAQQVQDLLLQLRDTPMELLCQTVTNPGTWVLLAALHRTEAHALFALGGPNPNASVSRYPWHITVSRIDPQAEDTPFAQEATVPESPVDMDYLRSVTQYRYPYSSATTLPSKRTATDMKGRFKDMEAAQEAQPSLKPTHVWRKPSFAGQTSSSHGADFGNAMHKAMACVRMDCCGDNENLCRELDRLADAGTLTRRERQLLNTSMLLLFFRSAMGQRICQGREVLREFKFSILVDAEQSPGERVLLQGVVDCALVEEDGLVVLDFKSDYVNEEIMPQKIQTYTPQVMAYAAALERIYKRKVKEKYLYFFRTNALIAL